MTKIEIVAKDLEDIEAINQSRADRIILLDNFEEGGTTPLTELVRIAKLTTDIPIRVMIRHRSDTYVYDDKDMKAIIKSIKEVKALGVEGIAFGSLTDKGDVNIDQLKEVIEAKGDLKLTYNKAFDEIEPSKLEKNFDSLAKLDVDVLMTSCQRVDDNGKDIILPLAKKNTLDIMPGAGIKAETAKKIAKKYNATFLHVASGAKEGNDISIDKISELKDALEG